MIRVSLSDVEKSVDAIWLWYERASTALRLRLHDERGAAPVPKPVFLGLTSEEVSEFFQELDFLTILDLLSATEAAIRVDFWTRVHAKAKDSLSREFRSLAKRKEEKIALEEHILASWVRNQPDLKSQAGAFKGALKFRNWLAHGRYWTPKLAQAYAPTDVFDICREMLVKMGLHLLT